MISAAKIYFILFGLLTLAGGIIGYMGVGSVQSLVIGSVAGIIFLIGGFLISPTNPVGLWVSLIASVLIAGRFLPKLLKGGVHVVDEAAPLRVVGAWIIAAMGPLGVVGALLAFAALFLKK